MGNPELSLCLNDIEKYCMVKKFVLLKMEINIMMSKPNIVNSMVSCQ